MSFGESSGQMTLTAAKRLALTHVAVQFFELHAVFRI